LGHPSPSQPARMPRRLAGAAPAISAVVCLIGTVALASASGGDSTSSEQARAYYLFSLAQQAQFRSELPEALHYLEEAVRTADSSDLRLELAELYSSMNKSEDAEREARQAVMLDPASATARSTLAQILFLRAAGGADPMGRLKESESLYQDLLDQGLADEAAAQALSDLQRGREDLAAAAATLERYRAAHSSSVEVDFSLARIYVEMGRSEEARKLLEGAMIKAPDSRETRQLLADLLEDAGEAEKAVEVFRPVTESNPSNPYGQYRLGTLLNSSGDYGEAQEHLRLALQTDPGNVRVLLALGQSLLGGGDNRQAEDIYQRALERDASSLEARFFLGRIAQARAEDDRALTLYGQILSQTAEKQSTQDRAFFGLASFQTALIEYLHEDYSQAIPKVQDAIEVASRPSSDLYGLLIRIHIDSGNLSQAREDSKQALAILPGNLEIQAIEGEILLREGERTAARERFREILRASQSSEDGYLLILQACSRAEAIREGVTWARQGVEAHPDSEPLVFQQAALLERAGDFKASERAFRELLQQHPDNAEALNYLGYMLADRGVKLEEALGLIQKAVSIQPENPAFLDSLGWVLFRLGRAGQAESYLVRAAQGSRDDATVLEHLGDVQAKLGQRTEALKSYRKALDNGPEHPEPLKKKIRKLSDLTGGA
jgi:tetratricopeptide (TPR) repeat protein